MPDNELKRPADRHIRWAAQAVTFYAPHFWNAETLEQLTRSAAARPEDFYGKLLSAVEATGVDYLELCSAPGDWRTARAAYGTADTFSAALRARRLALSGSYQAGHDLEDVLGDESLLADRLDNLRAHAEFIRGCGATLVLTGPPRRYPFSGGINAALPDSLIKRVGSLFEQMGATAAEAGVTLAIHTEAYSCVCRPEDIRRVLQATDPSLVSLCLDAGHVTLDGGDVVQVIKENSRRIASLHWKDCAGPRSWLPEDGKVTHEMMMEQFRRAGTGVVDWKAAMVALRSMQFDGFAAAEIDLAPEPIAATRAILEFFDRELASIYQ